MKLISFETPHVLSWSAVASVALAVITLALFEYKRGARSTHAPTPIEHRIAPQQRVEKAPNAPQRQSLALVDTSRPEAAAPEDAVEPQLSGTVRVVTGGVVANATVELLVGHAVSPEDSTRSSLNGDYALRVPEPSALPATLRCSAAGYATALIDHVNVPGAYDFQLQPAASSVRGRVECETDGAPVAGATVSLWDSDGETKLAATSADDTGAFSFHRVAKGLYLVAAAAPEHIQSVLGVSVDCNAASSLPTILTLPDARLFVEGDVRDSSTGEVIIGAVVEDLYGNRTVSDGMGHFVFPKLEKWALLPL